MLTPDVADQEINQPAETTARVTYQEIIQKAESPPGGHQTRSCPDHTFLVVYAGIIVTLCFSKTVLITF